MEETLQLLSFLVSFLYGIFFGIVEVIHYRLTKNYHIIFKYLTTLFFVIDISLGYLLIMYHINQGVFHLYFMFFSFLGFFLSFPLQKYVKKYIKIKFKIGKKKKL